MHKEIYYEYSSRMVMEACEIPKSAVCKLETQENQWCNYIPRPKTWEPGELVVEVRVQGKPLSQLKQAGR